MKVKVINKSNNSLPQYSTTGAAGMDIRASLTEAVKIPAKSRVIIPTGLFMEIPEGYEVQIRPRSGLAFKHGLTVINSPGTIDSDYRGEVCVIIINHGDLEYYVNPGERIAQMVLAKYERVEWSDTEDLSDTARGEGGIGHTGVN
jgi:dUTP pyrophosphatase